MTNTGGDTGDYLSGTGFQVPSFGDEDFDLLQVPLILPSEQPQGHGVSTDHDMFNTQTQPLSHQQITNMENSHQVTMASNMQTRESNVFTNIGNPNNVAPKFPPQNFYDPDINMTNAFQGNNTNYGNSNIFQNIAMTTSGMFQGQSSQGQMATSGQHQPLSTICHSQITNQLGFQTHGINPGINPGITQGINPGIIQGMNQGSPMGSNSTSVSPNRESTSEDSDDSLPLAQLVSLKRQAALEASSSLVNTSTPRQVLTASPPAEPEVITAPPATKKMKTPKRKKKKDPNEPQKPVSAYALFFRDTQAAIKGQNPSASFGEVSKIVASMWDGLDPEHKNVYKKKTEMAKKEYLKQLAAYRASQVSLAAVEEANTMNDKSPSPPYQSPRQMPQSNQRMGDNSQMMAHSMEQMSPPQVINYSPPHQQQSIQHIQNTQYTNNNNNGLSYQPQPIQQNNYGGRILSPGMCIRNGCANNAINNPGWDEEYCSSECVVSHCRDVFTAWVASRQASSSFPVK
ncbi:TOX high mobility group box family member 4 isoform X3 [Patella vulgata]|nr:TOX high mobility group box family member 4 isoform X3 [Patella vulgata]XP_050398500.2 TOX high mobility group box family member 4 isoform X3 [Patella vulgata]